MRRTYWALALACALGIFGLAPAMASATTTVESETFSSSSDVTIEADDSAQNLVLAAPTSTTLTVSGSGLSPQAGCTGTPILVTCSVDATDVYLYAQLFDGDDVFDASALPSSYSLEVYGNDGADRILGGAGDDDIYLDDGQIDATGSSCGGGYDFVTVDASDPSVSACENTDIDTNPHLHMTTTPVIVGAARAGSTLSVGNVGVSGGSYELNYYWYTCATSGGDGCGDGLSEAPAYTPTAADVGRYMFVDVEALPSGGGCCGDDALAGPVQVLGALPAPSSAFTLGAFKSGKLSVFVPGPGVLTSGPVTGTASAAKKKKKKKAKALVGKTKLTVNKTGIFSLPVKLSSAGKKQNKKKKIKTKVLVTFTPTGGSPASQVLSVTFKKK